MSNDKTGGQPPATHTTPVPAISLDAFIPPEMAVKAEGVGVKKAVMGPRNTFALALLAGAFIALGRCFCHYRHYRRR